MDTPNYERLLGYIPDSWDPKLYVLSGSACLAERGVRDVGDLDVLIDESLWPEVQQLHTAGHFPPGPDKSTKNPQHESNFAEDGAGRRILFTGQIDFFVEMPRIFSLGPEAVFERAQTLRGRRVVCLRHCLAIKALIPTSRIKDVQDMVILADLIAKEEHVRT